MTFRSISFLLLSFFAGVQAFAVGKKVNKIVIDAGHGGTDPGARGQISSEKDLTLAIALRVGRMISDSMRDLKVIYTRTSDIYPTLQERHEIANRANADLFLSIHINSTAARTERVLEGYRTVKKGRKRVQAPIYRTISHRETNTRGTESYVLGLHRTNQNDNAIGSNSENMSEEGGLLNENDPQTEIIIAQYSQAFLNNSVNLGTKIQNAFAREGRGSFGVKQKGLEVLAGSAMPGVLVECGFINNVSEEQYMNSEEGQTEIAYAIFQGIRAYKLEKER